MVYQDLRQILQERALQSLTNSNEVTDVALDRAVSETIEAIAGKSAPSWAVLDFAYARLKIYLKIAVIEEELELFKIAKKAIDVAPIINNETGDKKLVNLMVDDKISNFTS